MWQRLVDLNPVSKNTIILTLLTVNLGFFAYIRASRDSLKKAEAMYDHPATSQNSQVRRERGPVKIVEHIVEGTAGTRTIDRTITQEPVITTTIRQASSTPVNPIKGSSARYLLGGSWRISVADRRNGTVWAGYSMWDRIDLLGGVGYIDDHFSANLMMLSRWGK